MEINKKLFNDLPELPTDITMRHGTTVTLDGDIWRAGDIGRERLISFEAFPDFYLKYVAKLYLSFLLQTTSLSHTMNNYREIKSLLKNHFEKKSSKKIIIQMVKSYIKSKRGTDREYLIWYIKSWYSWCSDMGLSFFCSEFTSSLSMLKISGNPKGRAVLSLSDTAGPLDESDLFYLISSLEKDSSCSTNSMVTWLLLTLGCNPRSLCLIKWEDFSIFTAKETGLKTYILKVPRIKKRLSDLRGEFKSRELDRRVGERLEKYYSHIGRPDIFNYIFTRSLGQAFNSSHLSILICKYINDITVSSERPDGLAVSPRRLRYTFATRLVMAGASKEKLADLLDHCDLQHVQVYYDLRHKIKNFLSEAESKKLGEVFRKFEGNIISKKDQKGLVGDIKFHYSDKKKSPILGNCSSTSLCDLDPPFSCFLCPKFNAFEDSLDTYKTILSELIQWSDSRREEYGENDRIATVRNDIIISLGDLVQRIEKGQE